MSRPHEAADATQRARNVSATAHVPPPARAGSPPRGIRVRTGVRAGVDQRTYTGGRFALEIDGQSVRYLRSVDLE